jgi:hypothetical protein
MIPLFICPMCGEVCEGHIHEIRMFHDAGYNITCQRCDCTFITGRNPGRIYHGLLWDKFIPCKIKHIKDEPEKFQESLLRYWYTLKIEQMMLEGKIISVESLLDNYPFGLVGDRGGEATHGVGSDSSPTEDFP